MAAAIPSPSNLIHRKGLLDRVGATGSMLCAVHCAALPLVLVLTPAIGAGLASESFEIGFIAFASLLGLTSLLIGYRRHRRPRPLFSLSAGMALLWSAVLIPTLHHALVAHALAMASGGTMLAVAHVLNLRLSHRHEPAETCCL